MIGLLLFVASTERFVRTINVPSEGQVNVVVGFERGTFAEQYFSGVDDWQMLRRRGFTDEEIKKL